jgi:hypothetical protein
VVLVLLIASCAGVHAVELINPAGVTLDASAQFFPVGNLANSSGLSGPADITNYTGITHAGASGSTAWVTNAFFPEYYSGGVPPVMTFDLGGLYKVSDLVVWGYHFGSPNNNEAKTFDVEFSTDGANFGGLVTVNHARTAANQETLPLGGDTLASHVRLTITDNHYQTPGAAGGDRVGLGEVKFIGSNADISSGKAYSYTVLPRFSGGTYYFDDPHVQVPGTFDTGDLTDGLTFSGTPTIPVVSTIVGWGDPVTIATDVIIDLAGDYYVEGVRLGTHTYSPYANGAPDDVLISFSTTGTDPGDFFGSILTQFAAPPANGHHDLDVFFARVQARYVKLAFDGGAVLTGNTPNKWMLDEVTVVGEYIPEPATVSLALLGMALLARRRRK